MPRIDAPTVREHRENVRRKLIDAAEEIVRRDGVEALSAGAVSKVAGIARNSIYRYVDSVDDLRGLVLARYLPQWMGAVEAALAQVDTPEQRIRAWVGTNLAQAAVHGHGWLMEVGHPHALGSDGARRIEGMHRDAADVLTLQWRELLGLGSGQGRMGSAASDVDAADMLAALTRGLVEGGFRCLDRGGDLETVTAAIDVAVDALIDAHRLRATSPTM